MCGKGQYLREYIMAESFNNKLIGVLKTDPRFLDDEGELVKAAVIDRAWKVDRDLVKLLLYLLAL